MNWFIKFITPKDYEYFNYIENPCWFEAEYPYHKYRVCKNTGEFQKISIHCLGLNPPEYHTTWETLNHKPHFVVKEGIKQIKE